MQSVLARRRIEPAAPDEIPLSTSWRHRVAPLLRSLLFVGAGSFVVVRTLFVTFSWQRWANGFDALGDRITFAISGIAIGGLLIAFGSVLARPLFARRGVLRFEGDQWVIIKRYGVLMKPFVVARSDIEGAVVGDLGDLISRREGARLPLVAPARERPNLTLIFKCPLEFSGPARALKLWANAGASYLPIPRRRASGLLLEVADVEAARAGFERWGLLRDHVDEPPAAQPTDDQWLNKALVMYATYALLLLLVVAHSLNWIADPAPDRCPPTTAVCPAPSP